MFISQGDAISTHPCGCRISSNLFVELVGSSPQATELASAALAVQPYIYHCSVSTVKRAQRRSMVYSGNFTNLQGTWAKPERDSVTSEARKTSCFVRLSHFIEDTNIFQSFGQIPCIHRVKLWKYGKSYSSQFTLFLKGNDIRPGRSGNQCMNRIVVTDYFGYRLQPMADIFIIEISAL